MEATLHAHQKRSALEWRFESVSPTLTISSMSSCRGHPQAFSSLSHRQRPNEKFTGLLGYFSSTRMDLMGGGRILRAPSSILSGLLMKPMWRRRVESRGGVQCYSSLPRACNLPSTLLQREYASPVPDLVVPSPGEHSPDHPRRNLRWVLPVSRIVPCKVVHRPGCSGWPDDLRSALVAQKPQTAWCCLL